MPKKKYALKSNGVQALKRSMQHWPGYAHLYTGDPKKHWTGMCDGGRAALFCLFGVKQGKEIMAEMGYDQDWSPIIWAKKKPTRKKK
jgi:hypothetical protein